ncbi:hypothetical protein SDRG_13063 [Saprolegnia diclina VS20]|uniref:BAR domain-containing protein n=1 Tax=Saprolegnia diclina (strain VS20) TaxID=1156394 RepID=T0PUJ2_SAPDV|nr:hypothetical protein SDRG_13063 [Saprolegnia diclina VS20]EQC29189.1 hypothetical protein SDRG_13063 [Saprolegnia diclina VS20]|eukprot:XP_008617367.1 hypothetical protein SDRG_13063 [Saprolegnia diclina VS20]
MDKYLRLLTMGMPREHVELKMRAEGADPSLLPSSSVGADASVPPPPSPPTAASPSLQADDKPAPSASTSLNDPRIVSTEIDTDQSRAPPRSQELSNAASANAAPSTAASIERARPAMTEKMFTVNLSGSGHHVAVPSLRDRQRRWLQKTLVSFGRATPTPDDVYVKAKDRFLGLLKSIVDIRASLSRYKAMLPQYSLACAQLGVDVWCVTSADAVGRQSVAAETFRHAMCAINEKQEIKSHFFNADAVLSGAIQFVDIHIRTMESFKPMMQHREALKLDYDSFDRSAQAMRRAKRSVPELSRADANVATARAALDAATLHLFRHFAKYEAQRDTMLDGELEMVRQVMHTFYEKSAEVTRFTIDTQADAQALRAKEDSLLAAMTSKGLLTPPPAKDGSIVMEDVELGEPAPEAKWTQQLHSYRSHCPKIPEIKRKRVDQP